MQEGSAGSRACRRLPRDPHAAVYVLQLLLLWELAAGAPPGASMPCAGGDVPWQWRAASDCSLDLAAAASERGAADSIGLHGPGGGRPPTVSLVGEDPLSGARTASISNVIVSSSRFPSNSISLEQLLWPPLLAPRGAAGAPASASLTNVQLLYVVPRGAAAVAVATLRGVVSDPVVQQGVTSWSLNLYTDHASFVYLNSWSSPGLECSGCGVFLQFEGQPAAPTATPGDATAPGVNYVLAATAEAFVPALERYATIATPRPLLVLLGGNVSWAPADDPAANANASSSSSRAPPMPVRRPLVVAGQAGVPTSLDLGMRANRALLEGPWGNVTFDGLVVENLAYGDRRSGEGLSGLSLVNTFNLWFFLWDRQDVRLMSNNVTHVAASQREVEYLSYWYVMFSSSDPQMQQEAAWMKRGPGITIWEAVVTQHDLLDVRFMSRSAIAKDTWRSARPRVAAPLPMALDDPELYAQPLRTHAAAPLAALANTNSSLRDVLGALSGLQRDGLVVAMAPLLSLGADRSADWPPLDGVVLGGSRTSLVGYSMCHVVGNSSSGGDQGGTRVLIPDASSGAAGGGATVEWPSQLPQERLLADLAGQQQAARLTACGEHGDGGKGGGEALERLGHAPMLDLGQQRGLVSLRPSGNVGTLEVHGLTLLGLAQGPNAAAAAAGGGGGSNEGARRRRRLLAALSGGAQGGAEAAAQWQRQQQAAAAGAADRQPAVAAPAPADGSGGVHREGAGAMSLGAPLLLATEADGSGGVRWVDARAAQHWGEPTVAAEADGSGGVLWVPQAGPRPPLPAVPAGATAPLARPAASASTAPAAGAASPKARPAAARNVTVPAERFWVAAAQQPEPAGARAAAPRRLLQQAGGAAAAPAGAVGSPEVWTHLVWAVDRSADGAELVLVNVQMLLPKPEFDRLRAASEAAPNGAFTLPLRGSGDGMRRSLRASASRLVDGCCLLIDQYSAPGLNATGLLLLADPDEQRSMPRGYYWPSVFKGGGARSGNGLRPAEVAGIAVGTFFGLLLLVAAAALLCCCWRRRRQRGSSGTGGKTGSGGSGGGGAPAAEPSSAVAAVAGGQAGGMVKPAAALAAADTSASDDGTIGTTPGTANGSSMTQHRDSSSGASGAAAAAAGAAGAAGVLADGRWLKLTSAISGKVQGIHENRLRSALLGSQLQPLPAGTPPGDGGGDVSAGLSAVAGGAADSSRASLATGSGTGSRQRQASSVLQLKEVIGQGSFGVVYRAVWQGVSVAVKLLQLPPGTCARTLAQAGGSSGVGSSGFGSSGGGTATGPASRRGMGGLLKQEHMAVQEAAVGSTMMHPNIVAVYSITLRPAAPAAAAAAPGGAAGPGTGVVLLGDDGATCGSQQPAPPPPPPPSDLLPWEMQLIMEYCDQGTLRQALDAQALVNKASGCHHIPIVLSLAHNVACAMAYLHQERIIHGDLKASNVLLKTSVPNMPSGSALGSSGGAGSFASGGDTQPQPQPQAASDAIIAAAGASCGGADSASGMHCLLKGGWVVAKVADFGLSLCVPADETHVSSVHAGTITHMAPELLMHGHCSQASDVYAYGILLWELSTGGKAFAGIPKLLLGHCIVTQRMRPCWPANVAESPAWAGVRRLAELCWAQDPAERPTFGDVVAELAALLRSGPSGEPGPAAAASSAPAGSSPPGSGDAAQQQQAGGPSAGAAPAAWPAGGQLQGAPPAGAFGGVRLVGTPAPARPPAFGAGAFGGPGAALGQGGAPLGGGGVMHWFQGVSHFHEAASSAAGDASSLGLGGPGMCFLPMGPAGPWQGTGSAAASPGEPACSNGVPLVQQQQQPAQAQGGGCQQQTQPAPQLQDLLLRGQQDSTAQRPVDQQCQPQQQADPRAKPSG